jgi:hypothetical protein
MWSKLKKWFWTSCRASGHDWYVIRSVTDTVLCEYGPVEYEQKVCLQCKEWVDEINPYRQRVRLYEFNKKSRAERAKELWMNRYNPNK